MKIQNALVRALSRAQEDLTHDTLRLARHDLKTLAAILVGFAEDVTGGVGIWASLERYNREFFGTPLPFITPVGADPPPEAVSPERLRHLLWVLYAQMSPGLVLAPDHVDLRPIADAAAAFLREHVAAPTDSLAHQVLGTPDANGWDVKRKLIWLGTESYLFRTAFERYVAEQDANHSDIAVTDEFLCRHCTEWSGLGALEVLAAVLDLPPARRADLLAWSERHNALYQVLSGTAQEIELRNRINDRTYRVRQNLPRNPFPRGSFVLGSLVPWDGAWYWSGQQQTWPHLDTAAIDQMKRNYRKLPAIYYRYSPEHLQKAREFARKQHEEFVARHGRDWVVFPDGLAMAADWQKAQREQFAALPADEQRRFLERHGLKEHAPQVNLPPELLEMKNGIGVYSNPEEGQEIMPEFNDVLSGLRKRGVDLSADEAEAVRGLVRGDAISPGFVRRLAGEFGAESIRAAFLLGAHAEDYALEYLVRRFKGHFYRPRYPTITLV